MVVFFSHFPLRLSLTHLKNPLTAVIEVMVERASFSQYLLSFSFVSLS
jgi:hypothetical protein